MLATIRWLALTALLAVPAMAMAGPPYVTDDPEPTDTGRWETYLFATAQGGAGQAGLDLNYGGARDLQLTAFIPLEWQRGGRTVGLAEIELAAKYRFLQPAEGSPLPDVALYPLVSVPTGPFSNGHVGLVLPVWAQKDFGPWSVFGGGGYAWTSGQRGSWTAGLAVQRKVTDQISVGAEFYRQGPATSLDGKDLSGADLALLFKVAKHWSLIASGGPVYEQGGTKGAGYVALKADS